MKIINVVSARLNFMKIALIIGDILNRIVCNIKIFFLNPRIFLKKAIGRILLEVIPSPKGEVETNIGEYVIKTLPSRNDWWKYMYLGYCGIEIADAIRKFLPLSGVFIDVGAGVGYFSAIASDIIGISGQVHCFEPNPSNAKAIRKMVESNPNSNIILNDYALGEDEGLRNFYIQRFNRSTSGSMIDNVIEEVNEVKKIETKRLDTYLEKKRIGNVSLIKIDVEGYEYYVLKGLSDFLEKTLYKPFIICEIFLPAYKRGKFFLADLEDYMKTQGYQAYSIFNNRKKVDIRLLHETTDVIFKPVS